MRMSFVSVLLLSTLCCMTTNGQAQPKVKLKTMVPAAPIETNHRPQSKLKGSVKVYSLPAVMAEGDKIWEDFAKFTVGSEETPSIREVNDEKGNIAEKYTQMPGWSGGGVFQAGGVAYIGLMILRSVRKPDLSTLLLPTCQPIAEHIPSDSVQNQRWPTATMCLSAV